MDSVGRLHDWSAVVTRAVHDEVERLQRLQRLQESASPPELGGEG